MAIEPKLSYSDRSTTEDNPVPRQYRDYFAAIILRALSDIMEGSQTTIPYAWFDRKSGLKSFMEHHNATTARTTAMAWIFNGDKLKERPTYTLAECCEHLNVTVESVQKHAALINKWTKLGLKRGDSPNVADNIGREKLIVDVRPLMGFGQNYHSYFK